MNAFLFLPVSLYEICSHFEIFNFTQIQQQGGYVSRFLKEMDTHLKGLQDSSSLTLGMRGDFLSGYTLNVLYICSKM